MSKRPSRAPEHAALRSGTESDGSSLGHGRSAGAEAMADPDTSWDIVAEASDQSFPCSDPPSWLAIRVGESMNRDEAA